MSDYTNIIQEINTNIPDNTDQSITALKVRTTLIDMLDAVDDNMTEAIGEISVPTKTSDLTNDSGFITATSLEPFITKTELSNASYVSHAELNSASYVTQSALNSMNYATQSFVDDAISDAVVELNIPTKTSDLTNDSGFITATSLEPYVTKTELSNASYVSHTELNSASYVTQSALNNMSYATTSDLNTAISGINVPTKTSDLTNDSGFITASALDGYVTESQLQQAGYVTEQALATASYVTQSALNNMSYATTNDLAGYATETYVADYVATHSGPIDLSAYVSKDELNQMGYVSQSDLSNASYVTSSDLSNMSYATTSDLNTAISGINVPTKTSDLTNDSGFITSIPAEYVTESELSGMGYVTSTELSNASYVTQSALNSMSYVTSSALSNMSYATTTQVNAKQDALVSGTNIKTINNESLLGSGNITITGGSNISKVTQSQYDAMEQAGTLDQDTLYVITDAQSADLDDYVLLSDLESMSYATTTQVNAKQDALVSGTNIKTINNESLLGSGNITITGGSSISEVTQDEYDAMEQAGTLDPDIIYVITDAAPTDLSYYVLQSDLENMGYVTSTALSNMSYATTSQLPNMSDYVSKTELNSASYATTTQVNAKQDALVSGTNIKTINNESLLGSGNINITGGGSTVTGVTQAQYDAMEQGGTLDPTVLYVITDATGADLSDYVEITYLETYYADKSYVVDYVAQHTPTPDMSAYVTKTELSAASYVTQTQLNNAGYLTSIPNTYATYAAISNMGYLTSANFIYNSSTNTLTISI